MPSYNDLFQYRANAEAYLSRNQKEDRVITFALKKVLKTTRSLVEDYQDDVQDQRSLLSLKGDKKEIIVNAQGQYQYTAEAEIELRKRIKELGRRPLPDSFKPHFVKAEDVPEDLSFYERNAFEGFVLEKTIEE